MARLDPTGVSRILTYIKTWITGLLSNKSDSTHTHSDYVPRSGGGVLTGVTFNRTTDNSYLSLCGSTDWDNGASITLSGKDRTNDNGDVIIRTKDNSNLSDFVLRPNGTATWANKNLAMQEDVIPRNGGAVITGTSIGRDTNTGNLDICGGINYINGGFIALRGKDVTTMPGQNGVAIIGTADGSLARGLTLFPNGTLTWEGQPIQYGSDARLKQQIAEIDDKLLDAWEDVHPCQFKYNDAVDQKGDTARLHTGYVVQQIDEACKSHNLDISAYGLYCHEEYSERTEEVEVKQDDGSVIKETKVLEPAREHYSLRYTEALIVECAFLRREVKRLSERLEKLEK